MRWNLKQTKNPSSLVLGKIQVIVDPAKKPVLKKITCDLEDELDATEFTPFSKMVDPVQDQNTSKNPVRSIN